MTVQQEATQGIILTDGAAAKVSSLLAQEGRDDLRLRIAVQPGGCSGLRYQLYFDEREIDGDIVSEFGGVQVVTDKMSAPYLMGATIDFIDTIELQVKGVIGDDLKWESDLGRWFPVWGAPGL